MAMKRLVKEIVVELKRINALPPTEIAKEWKEERDFALPSMLGRGDGYGTIISPKIDDNITKIRKLYSSHHAHLKTTYNDTELHKLLQNALGLAFASIDLSKDDDKNAEEILAAIDNAIQAETQNYEDREHVFGATLFFEKCTIPRFSIGPICFESRLDWLDRKKQEKAVSTISYRRIKKKWEGNHLKKRKNGHDSMRETFILDAIENAPFVCSVFVKGLPPETGKEKALVAARIALTVISLVWQIPSSVLGGFNLIYDRRPHLQKSLSFSKRGVMGGGRKLSQNHLHGAHIRPPDTWAGILKQYKKAFDLCGCILEHILIPSEVHNRIKVLNVFLHALIWFHAGCREGDNILAIVDYAACLDALSCGKKADGIQRLIAKQLGLSSEQTIFKNDIRTVKNIVDEVYGSARSRTIHGNNDRLGHDWTTTRTEAELLARLCLVNCLFSAAEDESLVEPEMFMESRKSKTTKDMASA